MLLADSLIVLGMATVSLGNIQEADGIREQSFWLRNAGTESVVLYQGYTSCGCTTIQFSKDVPIASGDSTKVTLRFNPQGKGGEFEETGTIVYGPAPSSLHPSPSSRLRMSLVGNCITSEETLARQFPIRVSNQLRLSANRFDLGIMHVGETKERNVIVLHRDEQNRQERIAVTFKAEASLGKGLKHIQQPIDIMAGGKRLSQTITFDVLIR